MAQPAEGLHRRRGRSSTAPSSTSCRENPTPTTQLGEEENWNARLEELFPFRFNTIGVNDGTVRFLAPGISTRDAITARRVQGAGHESHQRDRVRQGNLCRLSRQRRCARRRAGRGQRQCRCLREAADLRRQHGSEEGAASAGQSLAARIHQGGCGGGQVRAVHGTRGRRRQVQRLRQAHPAGCRPVSLERRGAECAAAPVGRLPRFRCRSARERRGRPGGRAHPVHRHHSRIPRPACSRPSPA